MNICFQRSISLYPFHQFVPTVAVIYPSLLPHTHTQQWCPTPNLIAPCKFSPPRSSQMFPSIACLPFLLLLWLSICFSLFLAMTFKRKEKKGRKAQLADCRLVVMVVVVVVVVVMVMF